MQKARILAVIATLALNCSVARAAMVEFEAVRWRYPTPAEIADGVPANSKIRNYFLSTDADVMSISNVRVETDGVLYQHLLGSNAAPPNPLHVQAIPSLGADSFITTPGINTQIFGVDLPGDGDSIWGDTSNDGAQQHFHFARLTVSPASAPLRFEFDVAVLGPNGVEIHTPTLDWPIEIMVPEPSAVLLAGLACGSALLLRRRTI